MVCTVQMVTIPGADGCDLLVDGGGDAARLIHKGREFEEIPAKGNSLPDPAGTNIAGTSYHAVAERHHPSGGDLVFSGGVGWPWRLQGDHYRCVQVKRNGCQG